MAWHFGGGCGAQHQVDTAGKKGAWLGPVGEEGVDAQPCGGEGIVAWPHGGRGRKRRRGLGVTPERIGGMSQSCHGKGSMAWPYPGPTGRRVMA